MWTALLFNRFTAAGLALALLAGAYWVHRVDLIQRGYDAAMAQVREAETDRLRELLRENSRLVGVVKGLQDVAAKQKQDIAAFRARQRADAQRLLDQQADFDQRLAAASAEALRRYAQVIDSDLGRCAEDVERFAVEAAQCSVAAHTLKNYIDARP